MVFAATVVGVTWFITTRESDRVNARATYDGFAEALVDRDYSRAFALFDDDMAARFGGPEELARYTAERDFFPVEYRLGVLSSRVNTIRFTMPDGAEREARVRVRGFRPEVVFFEIDQ